MEWHSSAQCQCVRESVRYAPDTAAANVSKAVQCCAAGVDVCRRQRQLLLNLINHSTSACVETQASMLMLVHRLMSDNHMSDNNHMSDDNMSDNNHMGDTCR